MPQDTLWLNDKGANFIIYDHNQITDAALIRDIQKSISAESTADFAFTPNNNPHNDSLLQTLISFERFHKENKFLEEKSLLRQLWK